MANANDKTLIVIAGPTASGKTAAAIQLARHFQTDIVSADSRQFFKEMSIGTAKPTDAELSAAPHHFISSHSVTQNFNVGDFEAEGLKTLDQIFTSHHTAILAGGSGLYVKAICEGFDRLPQAPTEVRMRLNTLFTENGIEALQQRLKNADPDYYKEVDIHNPQRLIRALEVYETTGQPFSSYRTATNNPRPFNIVKIGFNMPREILYDRINHRVDLMMTQGLLNEVESLLEYRHLNALNTVGYTEIFDHLDGKTDLLTAISLIKQHTRQFAKRQLTWFNKDKGINWINPLEENIIEFTEQLLLKLP